MCKTFRLVLRLTQQRDQRQECLLYKVLALGEPLAQLVRQVSQMLGHT